MSFPQIFLIANAQTLINTSLPGPYSVASSGPIGAIGNFYQFALMIAGLLAFGSIIWAGIQYAMSSGNPGKQGDARDQITQAFLGILLLVGAYLILNVINPDLTVLKLPTLESLKTQTFNYTPIAGGTLENEANIRAMLSSQGINVNADPPRTQLAGLRAGTINEVVLLKNTCKCDITITGGNEPGHASGEFSHGNGYKVDLALASSLNSYIENNPSAFRRLPQPRSDGAILYQSQRSGVVYAKENNHWDITIR
jgi:hypothetical protein